MRILMSCLLSISLIVLTACGSDGNDGDSSLFNIVDEPPGENCEYGGTRIETGIDLNGDQQLNSDEIENIQYICNGTNGSDGSDGSDGDASLFNIIDEPPGENCEYGGKLVETGIDLNENGSLDAEEVENSEYICNGLDGNRYQVLINKVKEPSCFSNNGKRIEIGFDLNENDLLDPAEVESVEYINCPLMIEQELVVGPDQGHAIKDIAVDQTGEFYVFGHTGGSMDGNPNLGSTDVYLIKYTADGTTVWTKQWGSSETDNAVEIKIDDDGNIYAGGHTLGDIHGANQGSVDNFITKFDDNGNIIWSKQWGTVQNDTLTGLTIDHASDDVYVSSYTRDAYPGYSNSGNRDAVLTKISTNHYTGIGYIEEIAWHLQWGSSNNDYTTDVVVDTLHNIYVIGRTTGIIADYSNYSNDAIDIFITKIEDDSTEIWTKQYRKTEDAISWFPYESVNNSYNMPGESLIVEDATDFHLYFVGKTEGNFANYANNESGFDALFFETDQEDGNASLIQQWGSFRNDSAKYITGVFGSVFIVGTTNGTIGDNIQINGNDIFVTKLDENNHMQYLVQHETSSYNGPSAAAFNNDKLFITTSNPDNKIYILSSTQ
ncbi:MAG: DUF7151 family protein [Myxococcota bacterium]